MRVFWRERRKRRECEWFANHQALLFGGYLGDFDHIAAVPPNPYIAAVLALAKSPGTQQLLHAAGGSVARMLATLTGPDLAHLTAEMARIDATHPDDFQEAPVCA